MIGIIVNPHARAVMRDPGLTDKLRKSLGPLGRVVSTRSESDLEAALHEFRTADCTLLGVCGGDGTNLSILTAGVSVWGAANLPRIALLAGGTMNTVARNLGIGRGPLRNLESLLEASRAKRDRTAWQEVMQVDGRLAFLFGAAMGARFIDSYNASPRGAASAAALVGRLLGSMAVRGPLAADLFRPVKAELTIEDEPQEPAEYTLILAATVRDYGLGMKAAWRAGSEAGKFHLVASGLPAGRLAAQIGKVVMGQPLSGEPHLDRMAQRVRLKFEKEEPYVVDGDLHRAREIVLEVGPRIRIALP